MTKSKINILHVINLCEIGGAESLVAALAEKLDKQRFNVSIATLTADGPLKERIREAGLNHHKLNLSNIREFPRKFARLVREQRFDIVQTHGARAECAVTFLAKVLGVPFVISTFHGEHGFDNRIKVWAGKICKPCITSWVAISNSVRNRAISTLNLSPEKVHTIYGGIDFAYIDAYASNDDLRNELGVKTNEKLVVTVANLRPVKGHKTILHAISNLPERLKWQLKFCFIGADQCDGDIVRTAEELDVIDRVVFTGFQKDIVPYLKASDIFLLASKSEGFGLSVLEAMAAGLPIIATRVGGISEIIDDGVTGLLIKPETPQAIVDKLDQLLENPRFSERISEAALHHVRQKFSIEKMVQDYSKFYQELFE